MSDDFEYIDIKPIKEDWSVYKLKDGTTIKIRYVLIKMRKRISMDKFGNPVYDLNIKNLLGIIPKKDTLGEYVPYDQKQISTFIIDEDMDFKPIQEPWNVYEGEDGAKIKVKAVLTTVSKTSKYGPNGEPIYLVNYQPIFKGLPAK